MASPRGAGLLNHGWQDLLIQGVFRGLLTGVVSIFVYTRAVADLGAAETAMFTATVPGLTSLGAIAVLGEWPESIEWAGVGIVTIGMLVAIRGLYGSKT